MAGFTLIKMAAFFTDDYNGDSSDFDFTACDFRISCDIQPTSVGNDYVWMKSSGSAVGVCLKLGTSGSNVIAYMRGINNVELSLGVIVSNATSTTNTILVERVGDVWTLYPNGFSSATATLTEVVQQTGGSGYKGF